MTAVNYYLPADVRELDRIAIQEKGILGFTLMQRAGQAAFDALQTRWPNTESVICFCGSGNNGGDGYVIAALTAQRGLRSEVIAVGSTDKLKGDARLAYESAVAAGATIVPLDAYTSEELEKFDRSTVLVDAMLGIGLSGNITGQTLDVIRMINASPCSVMSVDIPSGLCSDTGTILGKAVKADLTVTFIGRKLGQVSGSGPALCGELVFGDLDVPGEIYKQVSPAVSE